MNQQLPNSNGLNFSDAPGESYSLDDLFPNPEVDTAPAPSESDTAPQASSPEDVFLRAGETIYKSREDALSGIAHKDAVIQDLRSKLASSTGIDPITGKQLVVAHPQAQPEAPLNYTQDGSRYFDDLVEAVQKNDRVKYTAIQQKFIQDTLAPIAPVIVNVAKANAVENVSSDIPDFRTFQSSSAYKETLEAMPSLKAAIETGEKYLDASSQLPELYRLAYFAGKGRQAPELVRQAAQAPAPTQTSRPTTSPSTMTPPPPAPPADLRTTEGRKAIIAAAERAGVADRRW